VIKYLLQGIIGIVLCIFYCPAQAQGELQSETHILFSNEWSTSIVARSTGLGFDVRYGAYNTVVQRTIFSLQCAHVRHPKEIKLNSNYGNLVYAKLHQVFTTSLCVGRQKEHFSKSDKNSVALSSIIQAGISCAIEKPVYYYVNNRSEKELFTTSSKPKHGKAPFFYGVSESKFIPGLCSEVAMQCEFGKSKRRLHAVELGCNAQVYMRKLEIMHNTDNYYYVLSLFAAYRFGVYRN
jgi:hypothetical protein